ncbi:putative NADH-dependent butanol dehydrogenase 1 [Paenibacillus sp. J31TS4]|uniref:iron-containing alcohol dehydrogenase n=1 Tax=Paenibacillus sp. J31TS4 TaxID=2807195 RepID=UPI001B09CB76|nr:iron-containing alcohol dehydrogenase [Paenibacillus sp. J31TS4]GIP38089.1 putative NADH-dependent butanol dehydrogenase 1 [Paenibacillus sp. J31TS4]
MNPFIYQNPTKLIFGKGQLEQLVQEVPRYGRKVLLVYGGGSIKRTGLYDRTLALLKEAGAEVVELGGVEPNPRLSTVNRGAALCREHNIDLLLAVGGGSTIDCTKAIAAAAKFDGDFWDVVTKKAAVKDALPFGTVLTLAATGSEMNAGSVITNWELNEKHGWGSPLVYPRFSILDPEHTFTLPREQTVYGIVDMMSHIFEQYFHHRTDTPIQDGFCEALLRAILQTAPVALERPDDYEARETLMYAGTIALNGYLSMGTPGDWATHDLEHAISAVYDIPHGGGLAILFPNWMKHVVRDNPARFKQLGVHVFGVDPAGKADLEAAEEGIAALRAFWNSIGAPSRLADYDIDDSKLGVMADKVVANGPRGRFRPLERDDVLAIYRSSL